MRRKTGTLILTLAAALVFAGCSFGSSLRETETNETESAADFTYEIYDVNNIDVYQQLDETYDGIITQLTGGINSGWADYSPETLGFSSAFSEEGGSFGYRKTDLNGDKVNELIAGAQDGSSVRIYDLWSCDAYGMLTRAFHSSGSDYLVLTNDNVLVDSSYLQQETQTESTEDDVLPDSRTAPADVSESQSEETGESTGDPYTGAYVLHEGVLENTEMPTRISLKSYTLEPIK